MASGHSIRRRVPSQGEIWLLRQYRLVWRSHSAADYQQTLCDCQEWLGGFREGVENTASMAATVFRPLRWMEVKLHVSWPAVLRIYLARFCFILSLLAALSAFPDSLPG